MINLQNKWVSFSLVVLVLIGLCFLGVEIKDRNNGNTRVLEQATLSNVGDANRDGTIGPADVALCQNFVIYGACSDPCKTGDVVSLSNVGNADGSNVIDPADVAICKYYIDGPCSNLCRATSSGSTIASKQGLSNVGDADGDGEIGPSDVAICKENVISGACSRVCNGEIASLSTVGDTAKDGNVVVDPGDVANCRWYVSGPCSGMCNRPANLVGSTLSGASYSSIGYSLTSPSQEITVCKIGDADGNGISGEPGDIAVCKSYNYGNNVICRNEDGEIPCPSVCCGFYGDDSVTDNNKGRCRNYWNEGVDQCVGADSEQLVPCYSVCGVIASTNKITYKLGDANGDNILGPEDVSICQDYIYSSLSVDNCKALNGGKISCLAVCDMNQDGKLTSNLLKTRYPDIEALKRQFSM